MSTRIMALCWAYRTTPAVKGVLISLADQANDDGVCWPAVSSLAARTCLSGRAVQLALRTLRQQGIVAVHTRRRANGSATSNVYTINARRVQDLSAEGGGEPASPQGVNVVQGGGEPASPPEPSLESSVGIPPNPPAGGKATVITSTKRSEQAGAKKTKTFTEWIEGRRSLGADPIAGTDEVFAYAQHAGISVELIELHWLEFKTRYADSDRRQRQWPKAFRDSVRANSYRLWWVPPYQPAELTSVGRQAQAAHAAQAGADYDKTPRRQVSTPPMGPSVSAAHAGNPTPDKSLVGEMVVCAG